MRWIIYLLHPLAILAYITVAVWTLAYLEFP